MKRLLFIFAAAVMAVSAMGVETQQFTQDPKAKYRLYPTQNMYIFIRLDTSNGILDLVQWSTDFANQTIQPLSPYKRVNSPQDEKPGRFTLYATTNIYTFIMLDQLTGKVWQVQWAFEPGDRNVFLIEAPKN